MANQMKPLYQQVIFITGATSGIGLSMVRQAVEAGSKVFMVARNEDELQKIQNDMRENHYPTAYASADVAEFDQLQSAADRCLTTFGRIDTWINNAGITIYGKLMETTEEEARRLFDTNFWGMVNGCKIAVSHFRGNGGHIINIGSVLAKSADPLQGIYTAAEHATKGYSDSLRMELAREGWPISLSLIMPGAVDTPFYEHARRKTEKESDTFVSSPEDVANSILKCVVKPRNEVSVGVSSYFIPFMRRFTFKAQQKVTLTEWLPGALFSTPSVEGEVRSHYSVVSTHQKRTPVHLAAILAGLGSLFTIFRKRKLS